MSSDFIGRNKNVFCYILSICPEAPSGLICIKFGIGGPLVDVIDYAEFCLSLFRGRPIDFVVQIWLSSFRLWDCSLAPRKLLILLIVVIDVL